jgi:hypothetical protein
LPDDDMLALFDITVVLHGKVTAGDIPEWLAETIIRRLARSGLIADGATVGELGAFMGDLVQRLHFVRGAYDRLPDPSPRESIYRLSTSSVAAAQACETELVALGGSNVLTRETKPGEWEVLASFPDLPPDQSYHARVALVQGIANAHGGQFLGTER